MLEAGWEVEAGPALWARKAVPGFLCYKMTRRINYYKYIIKKINKIELFYSLIGQSLDSFKQESNRCVWREPWIWEGKGGQGLARRPHAGPGEGWAGAAPHQHLLEPG